jgi:hypothetical protein
VNGMDGRLRDLLDAAVGEPPHQVTAAAVRRRVIRRRVVEAVAGAVAVAVVVIAAIALVGVRTLGHTPSPAPVTRPHPLRRDATRWVAARRAGRPAVGRNRLPRRL